MAVQSYKYESPLVDILHALKDVDSCYVQVVA